MKIIETHCHLDYLRKISVEKVIQQSKEVGIDKIITIAVDPENQNIVSQLSKEYDEIYATQGIHPHDARLLDEEVFNQMEVQLQSNKKIVAVGEIGLDYHYNHSPREVQLQAFEKQMELATKYDKPIVIHSREAEEDTMAILKNYQNRLKRKAVLHSYTSSQSLAEYALSEDILFGFNGIITFPKAQNVRDILKIVPTNNIVIETDAPFLAPVPYRGKENSPVYLPAILEYISKLKGIDQNDLATSLYSNSCQLFNL
ncbi:MAG: TatD family hydrolase [Bacteriovoracia bacterium]